MWAATLPSTHLYMSTVSEQRHQLQRSELTGSSL